MSGIVNSTGAISGVIGTTVGTPAGGITHAASWRIHTNFTGSGVVTDNWEQTDTDGYGNLGAVMTQASGVFTFPTTGYWLITAFGQFNYTGISHYNGFMIQSTVDNGTYTDATENYCGIPDESETMRNMTTTSFQFDVTSTTTHKIKFKTVVANASVTLRGQGGSNCTHVTFIKLAGT